MALIITKAILVDRLNLAFNNNIIQFYSDSVEVVLKAEITIGINIITLYPEPSGLFYYNFNKLIVSLINTDNYKDDLQPDLLTDYVYNWTSKIILNELINVKIYLGNDTTEETSFTPYWLSGYVQLTEYKKTYPLNDLLINKSFLLAPTSNASNTSNYIKYWYGLPFDVTLWLNGENAIVTNNTNALSYDFGNDGGSKVNRLVFSDGDTSTTLEDVLPLQSGYNVLNVNGDFEILTEKITDFCNDGHYIKWINRYGGWSYWLFDKGNKTLSVKSKGRLNNNYNNLEDTISQTISLGNEANEVLQVVQDTINEQEFSILQDILDSAKIYLFTGLAFSQNTFNDWVEIELKNGNFRIENAKGKLRNLNLSFDLPERVTRYI
jgi:hypothetical protein